MRKLILPALIVLSVTGCKMTTGSKAYYYLGIPVKPLLLKLIMLKANQSKKLIYNQLLMQVGPLTLNIRLNLLQA
ncbi:hypothetical protein [Shewanella aestuarii]|uniref:Lipoprotein n=1 Tax=Shewanella aestuarii TaxID=1028752 RepID=A0A6G9QGB1_9GAMM|nr:hypothetical protein HBH39_00220 [Shewanella aestuarii]